MCMCVCKVEGFDVGVKEQVKIDYPDYASDV